MTPDCRKMTPPQIARLWGIATEKVMAWIRSGELKAIDAATTLGGRPRFLVDIDDLAAFERSRATTPAPVAKPVRKRTVVKQYV